MKILVALIHHESNSFNPEPTTEKDFKIYQADDILINKANYYNSSLTGIIDTLTKYDYEIVPTVVALPTSEGGLVSNDCYQYIKEIYQNELKKQTDIAGVCLALHGSMTTEAKLDVEGDILALTKQQLGKKVPITVALDMHAMVSSQMIENADAIVSYRTAPHIDKIETGVKAAELLHKILADKVELKMAAVKIPYLVSGEKSESAKYPMNELLAAAEKIEKEPGIISTSYCLGFPWTDLDFNHAAALVITAADQKLAQEKSLQLAELFWQKRNEFNFTTPAYSFAEAVRLGKMAAGPVFIIDSGDNPGAGSSQHFIDPLYHLIDNQESNILYASFCDPAAVAKLDKVRAGEKTMLHLGEEFADFPDRKNDFEIEVINKNNYQGVNSIWIRLAGIDLVIADQKVVMLDPDYLLSLKIKLNNYQLVILKSGYLAPAYQPYAKSVLLAITPGYTYQDLEKLNYHAVEHPIFPLDKEFTVKWQLL
ncbi:M81 family metallopeptidase [Halanaerobium salsuginis]|jgi:microcystin degradation protein MlrC|uniref:Microcystin degradation protein MlrC, contains DUF1485 domain n=1 Tax=Halanaerobium salsuginis TaxID=29563 RepID=A0A1I4KWJ8_9FIRM|nr:M81 family metallopeptidase [Halanaerobium salsuginis]SFL83152.1 Microcystin degradation protein MlrC, contains DUF1485 domain [Halanaerobium salsuginis]